MSTKPVISVVTPCLNAKEFIHDFLFSITSQTFQYWICILVDDGSTDGSLDLLRNLTYGDTRFLLVSNPSSTKLHGPASARNFALSLVKTPLVAFCDIDDLWHPEKLQRQILFHQRSRAQISVTGYSRFSLEETGVNMRQPIYPPPDMSFTRLRTSNQIPMLTVILSLDQLHPRFKSIPHEDYLLWLTLFKNQPNIRYSCLDISLSYYRVHNKNITRNRLKMAYWTYQVFRASGLGRPYIIYSMISWILFHLSSSILGFKDRSTKYDTIRSMLKMSPLGKHQTETSPL